MNENRTIAGPDAPAAADRRLLVSSPAVADDAALMRRALAGEREAWGALVARHDRRVRLVLVSRGVAPEQARDLAQEAWSRLLARQRRGDLARLELPGLAIAQALFLAIDAFRRAAREAAPLEDALAALQIADPSTPVDERLIGRQQLAQAGTAFAALGPSAQTVFRAVYDNPGASYAETAARLGLSEQRVKQLVCEVRKKIRAALEERNA